VKQWGSIGADCCFVGVASSKRSSLLEADFEFAVENLKTGSVWKQFVVVVVECLQTGWGWPKFVVEYLKTGWESREFVAEYLKIGLV